MKPDKSSMHPPKQLETIKLKVNSPVDDCATALASFFDKALVTGKSDAFSELVVANEKGDDHTLSLSSFGDPCDSNECPSWKQLTPPQVFDESTGSISTDRVAGPDAIDLPFKVDSTYLHSIPLWTAHRGQNAKSPNSRAKYRVVTVDS